MICGMAAADAGRGGSDWLFNCEEWGNDITWLDICVRACMPTCMQTDVEPSRSVHNCICARVRMHARVCACVRMHLALDLLMLEAKVEQGVVEDVAVVFILRLSLA